MFTHKFNRKENTEQGVRYFFDFTNGTKTYTDACVPQDENGLKFWIKSRVDKYDTEEKLDTALVPGQAVDISDPVVTPPVLTQAEIDRNTWLEKYAKWVRIKTTVVDTEIVPISNAKLQTLLTDLKTTLKPEYIDYI